ncbi:DUF7260 family protein [Halovenus halobia]|uniref:DUF7260 family protein n=1 Tax=Halovenus halobia TaxID=3396622 RepID=UPI003F54B5C5
MARLTRDTPELFIEDAVTIVENEQQIIAAELEAFQDFCSAVESTTPHSPTELPVATQDRKSSTDGFASLRESYRETVMSVPHFDGEYGESLATNVECEFGADVAAMLASDGPFGDHHKQVITCKTKELVEDRKQLLTALETEQDSLERFRDPVLSVLDAVESFERVDSAVESPALSDGYRKRMDTIERRCHELVDKRQSEIVGDRRALSLPISGPDLPSYLYAELPVTYPVVAPLTAILELAAGFDPTTQSDHSISS